MICGHPGQGYTKKDKSECECKIDISCLKDGPHGECLAKCDKEMDACYANSTDPNNIKICYQNKASCYMKCMGGDFEPTSQGASNCTVCACS